MELTKDAKKVICAAYAVYLEKRKLGVSKSSAKTVQREDVLKHLPGMSLQDYSETRSEIKRALVCTTYCNGSFVLPDSAIIYMENRYKNGLKDVLSFLAQFIP